MKKHLLIRYKKSARKSRTLFDSPLAKSMLPGILANSDLSVELIFRNAGGLGRGRVVHRRGVAIRGGGGVGGRTGRGQRLGWELFNGR